MSGPATEFDPYQEWLGIGPEERPCDHYRLLDVPRYEPDLSVIQQAADQRMVALRKYQTGPRGKFTQRLLNEIAAAKLCLLNPATKVEYDEGLRAAEDMQVVAPPIASDVRPSPRVAPPRAKKANREPVEKPEGAWMKIVAAIVAAISLLAIAVAVVIAVQRARPADVTKVKSTENEEPPVKDEPDEEPATETKKPEKSDAKRPPKTASKKKDKAKAKKTSPAVTQESGGNVTLTPVTGTLHGELEMENVGGTDCVTNWKSTDDRVEWKLNLAEPGRFLIRVHYSIADGCQGGQFQIVFNGKKSAVVEIPADAQPDMSLSAELEHGVDKLKKGDIALEVRAVKIVGDELLRLRSVELSPLNKP